MERKVTDKKTIDPNRWYTLQDIVRGRMLADYRSFQSVRALVQADRRYKNLLKAVIISIVAVAAAKGLPSLVEIIVLHRFQMTAGARYTAAHQISATDLKRWLAKSAAIQWDYKNIVKRKGRLERLK